MNAVLAKCCCGGECSHCTVSPQRFAFSISGISKCIPDCPNGRYRFDITSGTLNPAGTTGVMFDQAGECWWVANLPMTGTLRFYAGAGCVQLLETINVVGSILYIQVRQGVGNWEAEIIHEVATEFPWTHTQYQLFRSLRTFASKPNCSAFTPFLNEHVVSECDDPFPPLAYGQGICVLTAA